MDNFKPTFLYIKQHSITGLLYFGKTTKNPEKYKGSGKHWKRHLSKHGSQHVLTVWYCLFYEHDICSDFAIMFSEINSIVKSEKWANLIIENGTDGAPVGHPSFVTDHAAVSRKISEAGIRNWSNPEFRAKMILAQKESFTPERLKKQSEASKKAQTPERRKQQSLLQTGKKIGKNISRGRSKTKEHSENISSSLKGRKFSESHRKAISDSAKLRRVCRLTDHKEMSVCHFTRWLKSLTS